MNTMFFNTFNFSLPLSGDVNQDIKWLFSSVKKNTKFCKEKEIIDQYSYGEQLGKILDAVVSIIPEEHMNKPEVMKVLAMKAEIEKIKEKNNAI